MLIKPRCAWDIVSQTVFESRLPSRPISCVTHDGYVVLVLSRGRLLVWESSYRLVEVDTSLILDPRTLSCQDFRHPPLIIHPTERGTFFAVTRSASRPWPSVHEITPKGRGYAVSRVFEYIPSKMIGSLDLSGHNSVLLEVRRVDDQGTFQLMNLDPKDTKEPRHYHYLMFNILTKSFSTQSYWNPLEKHSTRYGTQSGVSCIWGGHLLSSSDQHRMSNQMLVVVEQRRSPPPFDLNPDDDQEEFRRYLQRLTAVDEKRTDLIQHGDIMVQCPTSPDYRKIFGFQYAIQAFAGACTHDGYHDESCRSGTDLAGAHGAAASALTKSVTHSRQDAKRLSGYRVDYIYMDDDFMVTVAMNGYTVFCVDADGEIAAKTLVVRNGRPSVISEATYDPIQDALGSHKFEPDRPTATVTCHLVEQPAIIGSQ